MKIKILFISILLLVVSGLQAQELLNYETSDGSLLLTITPKTKLQMSDALENNVSGGVGLQIVDSERMKDDMVAIIKQAAPNLSASDKALLQEITVHLRVLGDGSVTNFHYLYSGSQESIRKYEGMLFDIAQGIESLDFKQYGMCYTDPMNPRRNEAPYMIPFVYFLRLMK